MANVKMIDGSVVSSRRKIFYSSPLFVSLKRKPMEPSLRKPREPRKPRPFCPTFYHDCIFDDEVQSICYRPAVIDDMPSIANFVDFWLSGGAKRLGIPGGGRDYFIPRGQHLGYLKYKTNYLATYNDEIIGWSVKSRNETLIHLLVTPAYRGKGIGSHLLSILNPELIRSKSDQSTGDPKAFYEKHGYEVTMAAQGKHANIDIMQHTIEHTKVES